MNADPLVVPLRSRRQQRAQMFQKMQHAVPAGALLLQGLSTLGGHPHGFELTLGIVEVVAGALVAIAMARAIRTAARPHAHETDAHGIDWVDLAVAGVLAVEALEKWHARHHVARPTILTAIVMVVLGLGHGRIASRMARRHTLRVDDDGLYIGGKPFRAFRATWGEIAAIEVGDRWATVRTRGGRERRLDLVDLEDAAGVRRLLDVARVRAMDALAPDSHGGSLATDLHGTTQSGPDVLG